MSTTIAGPDGRSRCRWCGAAPEFLSYHDSEWGFPVSDDFHLFEKLSLESFQSGLSWRTILAKRENFRAAFHDFDFNKVARFTERNVERLLKDEGIVRHRGKIETVINNARQARELAKREGSLAAFIWKYEPAATQLSEPQSVSTSAESLALAKELKSKSFDSASAVKSWFSGKGYTLDDHETESLYQNQDKLKKAESPNY